MFSESFNIKRKKEKKEKNLTGPKGASENNTQRAGLPISLLHSKILIKMKCDST